MSKLKHYHYYIKRQWSVGLALPSSPTLSPLVHAMSAWSVITRRAPSRHSGRDARVYGHTTTAMHEYRVHPSPPPPPRALVPRALLFAGICLFAGWAFEGEGPGDGLRMFREIFLKICINTRWLWTVRRLSPPPAPAPSAVPLPPLLRPSCTFACWYVPPFWLDKAR